MEYYWKNGARCTNLNAQQVGVRLETIYAKHGAVTPVAVVADARRKNSPLHGGFEWDDARAAQQHRLEQARSIVRSVVVHRAGKDGEPMVVRAFVHVGEEGEYEGIDVVLSTHDKRAALLGLAWGELQAFRHKYDVLEELAEVFAAIDKNKP